MADVLPAIRLGIAMVMLLGAAVSDLRTRRVRNHYWFPFLALAAVFVASDVATRPDRELAIAYGGAALLCGFWYMVWWLGLFGGADAKALMVLSILLPFPLHHVPLPPSLDAVANGTLLVVAYPIVFLVWNAARGRMPLPAALLGVPLPLDVAQRRKVWPMQRVEDGRLRWRYWQRIGMPLDDVYRDLRRAGVRDVWTTPKVPFMVPIAFGLAATWRYGNIWLAALGAPYP